jgi:hypothetical protein
MRVFCLSRWFLALAAAVLPWSSFSSRAVAQLSIGPSIAYADYYVELSQVGIDPQNISEGNEDDPFRARLT